MEPTHNALSPRFPFGGLRRPGPIPSNHRPRSPPFPKKIYSRVAGGDHRAAFGGASSGILGFAFLIIAHQFDQRGDVVVARAMSTLFGNHRSYSAGDFLRLRADSWKTGTEIIPKIHVWLGSTQRASIRRV